MTGRTLSHYEVLEEISRGGMGIVYRARDVKLNRDVALKVLPPELVSDPERKRRFVQEAQAAAALDHPHIAVIYEIDEVEGVTFIAMELIRGGKLSDRMARERLAVNRSIELGIEVAEGLARAHDKGIVHRDLKPTNVMLTEDGHAKIIDFGLAKLVEPLSGASEIETRLQRETDPGTVMGTVSYMSPEQARGGVLDHRSDVFSFGVVLYEMFSGQLPFRGQSGLDTLHAILRSPAPPLPSLAPEASPEAAADLDRVLAKCLAKDPSERYQTIKDVVVDLRAVRRRLDSGSMAAHSAISSAAMPRVVRSRSWVYAAVAVLGLALAAAGVLFLRSGRSRPGVPSPSAKPSVAVLYFENNTGDPSLDWLRTALTDMLVTDLSQSPQVEVLGTDRLYQILQEMNRLDERITSFNVVQEVAQKANVQTVLLGSFVKAGDSIRLSIRLQDASSGRILTSDKVEGVGESSIFPMVDDLTRRIKARFEVPATADAGLDRDLQDVTTSSIEAYRPYAEGINLLERGKYREAIPLMEKAVAIDPGFSMALAKLAILHGNLLHMTEAEEYARKALEHVDRLSARQRYYIEGVYYSRKPETIGRALEAYEKAVQLYPDHSSARNNLALLYGNLERGDEAIAHYEELRRRGITFSGTYSNLARAYASQGEFQKGHDVLQEYLRRNPDIAAAHNGLGEHLATWGKLDEALDAFRKAEELEPGNIDVEGGRWVVFVLGEDWSQADAAARKLEGSTDPFRKWMGSISVLMRELYRGRSQEALRSADQATRAFARPAFFSGVARLLAAMILAEKSEHKRALEQARMAERDAGESQAAWFALAQQALVLERMGLRGESHKVALEYRRRNESWPTRSKIPLNQLEGELALIRGDASRAVAFLTEAEPTLPPRGPAGPPPPHVPLWYALASAHLATGDDEKAARYFRRIVESTTEHVGYPIPYVRSFYFLGKLHEKRGEMEKAREYYRRFIGYWKDGDLDRERVAEARSKIGT